MAKSKRQRLASGPHLPVVYSSAAGIDIGSRFHVAAVAPERIAESVRTFSSFTHDLNELADWLSAAGINSVATGVYWIPVYEILEAKGFEVLLVNARHAQVGPGQDGNRLRS